jgi:hypothetical protein
MLSSLLLASALLTGGATQPAEPVSQSAVVQSQVPAYQQGGFIENYIWDQATDNWLPINDGDSITLAQDGTFSWIIDAFGGAYVTIKHYVDGQLVEERTEFKDPDTLAPVQYWDVSQKGEHVFTEESADYPWYGTYGFKFTVK